MLIHLFGCRFVHSDSTPSTYVYLFFHTTSLRLSAILAVSVFIFSLRWLSQRNSTISPIPLFLISNLQLMYVVSFRIFFIILGW